MTFHSSFIRVSFVLGPKVFWPVGSKLGSISSFWLEPVWDLIITILLCSKDTARLLIGELQYMSPVNGKKGKISHSLYMWCWPDELSS